ncbi:hypothetical protein A2642_02770 [Candidatus Nomurabacteria bacterium RIFCSPHIGHO2_01_FULL_39_10]|uniref:Uncharacterized protein n=1 Tax=Candidatus Nomurabacteria bacterium RIFCSPHIGHO2_01_FULL_39_10 TaxID=1801733 RepID=A0A1F6VAJ2_9BACT|nr:MAG: hypothetical protein A2642_02770 [Candidatus Nomurabacteria bacterium RIFCSPHIGHO2_01_FULL_39_10]
MVLDDIVQPTEFEKLCKRVEKRNAIRERNFEILREISEAYYFLRRNLKMDCSPVSWSEVECVIAQFKKREYRLPSYGFYNEKDSLWNPKNQEINPDPLKQLIERETENFPPNTQELLDEKLGKAKKEETSEN